MFKKCNYLENKSKFLKEQGLEGDKLFKRLLSEFEGTPYMWGEETVLSCDCSGSICAALSYTRNKIFRVTANFLFHNLFTIPVHEKNIETGYVAIFFINKSGKAVHVAGYCGNGYFMNVSSIEQKKLSRKRTLKELIAMYNSFSIKLRKMEENNEYV